MTDNGATGSVPLFTPLMPPKIASTSHGSLVHWRKERRDYEAKLRARCRVTGEAFEAVVEPVAGAFNPHLLDTFCEFQMGVSAATVTDAMLTAEIEKVISSVKNGSLPDIKDLYGRELKLNMAESDCKRLMASLQPEALKKEVKQRVRFTDKAAATNPKLLFDLIVERAMEHERHYLRQKKQRQGVAGREANVSNKPKSKKQSKQPSPCPKCKAMHWLRECTDASEDEKKEIVQKLRDARKTKKARTKRLGDVVKEKLNIPVHTQTFGATWVTSEWKAKLQVLIQTAAGPVEPMGLVDVLIVDVDDEE
eukprot:jgi/Phyca11/109364/e_gw1.16.421.1